MRPVCLAAALLFAVSTFAQTPQGPSFEVATIKKADEPQPGKPIFFGRRGGPGTDDPGRITWSNVNLRTLLTTAYDVKPYQITGPDWIDSERYEIVAKVPAGATKEQVNVMWQNLLAERFGISLHHSSKVLQAFEMEAVKGRVKLQETAGPDPCELQWTGFSIPGPTTEPTDGSAEDLLGPPQQPREVEPIRAGPMSGLEVSPGPVAGRLTQSGVEPPGHLFRRTPAPPRKDRGRGQLLGNR